MANQVQACDGSKSQWSTDTTQPQQSVQSVQWPGLPHENFNNGTGAYNGNLNGLQNAMPVPNVVNTTYPRRDCQIKNGFYSNGSNGTNMNFINIPIPVVNGQSFGSNYQQASGSRSNWTPKLSNGVKKPKRVRTAFTTQQLMELENEYARTRYLDRNRRIELSQTLHLTERTIKVWYQNRRMKDKKDRTEGLEQSVASSTTVTAASSQIIQPSYSYQPQYDLFQGSMYIEGQAPMPTLDANAIPRVNQNYNFMFDITEPTYTPSLEPDFGNIDFLQIDSVAPALNRNETEKQNEIDPLLLNTAQQNIMDPVENEQIPEGNIAQTVGETERAGDSMSGESDEMSWFSLLDITGQE